MKSSLLLSIVLLMGCPEPVPEGGVGGAPSIPGGAGGEGAAPGGPGGEAGGAPGDGALASGAGTFGAELSKEELQPKYTQEELADGSTVKGTLECEECAGSLLVRVLPPPPESGSTDPEEKIQLITLKSFDSTGEF
ncbi:MAG: hypothetical protein QGG40_21615, partial [Myxococcota bacterium]|nr:hypothetical protein [Myxococcota bacterium]